MYLLYLAILARSRYSIRLASRAAPIYHNNADHDDEDGIIAPGSTVPRDLRPPLRAMHYFRHSYARSASSVFVLLLRPSRPRPTTKVHLASAARDVVLELPRVQASVVIRDDVSILRGAGSPGVARRAGVPGHRIPRRWQRRQSRGGERGIQAERRRGRRLRGERFVARDRSAARIRPAVPDEGEDRRVLPIAIIGASTDRTRVDASTRSGIDPAFGRGGSGHDRRIGERRGREIS